MSSFYAKASEVERKWHIIDAKGKPLGRVASPAPPSFLLLLPPPPPPHPAFLLLQENNLTVDLLTGEEFASWKKKKKKRPRGAWERLLGVGNG